MKMKIKTIVLAATLLSTSAFAAGNCNYDLKTYSFTSLDSVTIPMIGYDAPVMAQGLMKSKKYNLVDQGAEYHLEIRETSPNTETLLKRAFGNVTVSAYLVKDDSSEEHKVTTGSALMSPIQGYDAALIRAVKRAVRQLPACAE